MKSIIIFLLLVGNSFADLISENSFMLLTKKSDGFNYFCSGVAVAPRRVLTAAHCLDDAVSVRVVKNKSFRQFNSYIKVIHFEQHPDYNREYSYFLHDLGLLYLEEDIRDQAELVSIARLDISYPLTRIGFGYRMGHNTLNRFVLPPPIYDFSSYFHLYDDQSYSGDSGGPLFQIIQGEPYLVGIHSTLEGGSKIINVNASYYAEWIYSELEI